MKQIGLALACLLLAPGAGLAQQPAGHPVQQPGPVLTLSPGLTGLLRREMNALQQGMQGLVPAIVTGDWARVAETGEQLRDSYILQQQLTGAQRAELQRALPPAFADLDRAFHRAAGNLAHAAQEHNAELVGFYYYRLIDTCLACHGRFAAGRFPGLAVGTGHGEHEH